MPSLLLAASTLEQIRERGYLLCGVRGQLTGFSAINAEGNWAGQDVNYCQAIAVAVLADKNSVEYVRLNAKTRFPALRDGDIDVLIRNTTWTYGRDVGKNVEFTAVTFYDGQGFLAHRSVGQNSIRQVRSGSSICVQKNTTSLSNYREYSNQFNLDLRPIEFTLIHTGGKCLVCRPM